MNGSMQKRRLMPGCRFLGLFFLTALLVMLGMASAAAQETGDAADYTVVSGMYQGGYVQKFVYSDSMMLADASAGISPEMVKISASLAGAAYQPSYINSMLDQMGFSADNFQYTERNISYNDLVAYTLGMRTLPDSGKKVFILSVRGTSKNAEWFSNFNVGTLF